MATVNDPKGEFHYRRYVSGAFHKDYVAYQARYAVEPRESDKVVMDLVDEAVAGLDEPRILDIGCSTGNLLRHMKARFPHAQLTGGELSEVALETCRRDPDLAGISFERLDALDLPRGLFDVVVANAVLFLFDEATFADALKSVASSLMAGGTLVAFEFFHAFPQELAIVERSEGHPEGMALHFRSMARSGELVRQAGFEDVRFLPFEIPIDLPRGVTFGDNASGYESLNTYTERLEDGRRLLLRGALAQPWCHLVARKAR